MSMTRRQVAQDRMRLPNNHAVVVDDRDLAVRVHGAKLRRVQPAELPARLDVPVHELQFADQPHDFLQIERALSTPDREHWLPRWRRRPSSSARNNSPKTPMKAIAFWTRVGSRRCRPRDAKKKHASQTIRAFNSSPKQLKIALCDIDNTAITALGNAIVAGI